MESSSARTDARNATFLPLTVNWNRKLTTLNIIFELGLKWKMDNYVKSYNVLIKHTSVKVAINTGVFISELKMGQDAGHGYGKDEQEAGAGYGQGL